MQLYVVASRLPDSERYNLVAQIRRAAVSLTANVAEGYGRFHFKENIQYCRIARGSAYELIDHLITCQDERYLIKEEVEVLHRELLTFVRLPMDTFAASANRDVATTTLLPLTRNH